MNPRERSRDLNANPAHPTEETAADTAREARLAEALQGIPSALNDAGVWESLQPRVARARRRRTAVRLATAAVVLAGLLAGWQAVRGYEWDRTAGVTPVTHPVAPDVPTTATTPARSNAGVSILPPDSSDPRVDIVRRWTTALDTGAMDEAWTLLDPQTHAAIGDAATLAALSVDLGHNWTRGHVDGYQVIDGRTIADRDVAVVTIFGRLALGGDPRPASMSFVVVDGGGELKLRLPGLIEPWLSDTEMISYESPRLLSPDRDGAVLAADQSITFVVPTQYRAEGDDRSSTAARRAEKVPGPLVLAVDAGLVLPGDWTEPAGGASLGMWPLAGISDPGPLSSQGDHVVTVVQFRDGGEGDGIVSVASAAFTVASVFTDPDVLPRSVDVGTPYDAQFADSTMREDAIAAYLLAVTADDLRAFAAALSPFDQDAASELFADERAHYAQVGANGYAVSEIRFNWWQNGGWFGDWGPDPPPASALKPWAEWLQTHGPGRMVAIVTTKDGNERVLALEVGDGIQVRAPGSGGLKGTDILGRSPAGVMDMYLAAKQAADERTAFALLGNPPITLDEYLQETAAAGEQLLSYTVGTWRLTDPGAVVEVSFQIRFAADGHLAEGVAEQWRMERVDGLWKVGWLPRQ